MENSKKKIALMKLLLFMLLISSNCFSQNKRRQSNLPLEGEWGTKLGLNYTSNNNFIKTEIGIMKYNSLDGDMVDFSMMANHNFFASTEINLNKEFMFGAKVGYEINYVFVCGKISAIDYFDLKGNNNFCIRPEIGATLFGVYNLSYGYNFNLSQNQPDLSGKHVISLYYNIF